jgi:hypothetical protein
MHPTFRRLTCLFGAISSLVCLLPRCNLLVQAPDTFVPPAIDAGDGAPSTATACALSTDSGACGACLDSRCCDQERRCAESPACAEYERCLVPCAQDYACRAGCLIDHAVDDSPESAQLDQCLIYNCESACGVACGIPWTISEPDVATDCQQCIKTAACSAAEACGQSSACDEDRYCLESCFTRDCQFACLSSPDGGSQFYAFLLGIATSCQGRCGVGQYWECVDKVTWPSPKASSIRVTITLTDPLLHNPLANTDVTACTGSACLGPVSGTTDASGKVTLVLPASPILGGFSGFFALSPHPGAQPDAAPGDSASVMPYLVFMNGPLSEANATLTLFPFTRGEFEAAAASVGVALDAMKGHVQVIAEDCLLLGTSGAVITPRTPVPGMIEAYALGSAGTLALATPQSATDSNAIAFFFDAPSQQTLTFDVTPRSLGRVSSTVSLFVRPGTVSMIEASPGRN